MNLLDMVPSLDRQLRQYRVAKDTDSELAAYLADGVEALNYRWDRTYGITLISPKTYAVTPDITAKDRRPIILMAAIIYKMGNWEQAYVRDGDFAYDPRLVNAQNNPIRMELEELRKMVPDQRLASARTAPLRGFGNIYNRENYNWGFVINFI